jgi:chromosome segregation ATPase
MLNVLKKIKSEQPSSGQPQLSPIDQNRISETTPEIEQIEGEIHKKELQLHDVISKGEEIEREKSGAKADFEAIEQAFYMPTAEASKEDVEKCKRKVEELEIQGKRNRGQRIQLEKEIVALQEKLSTQKAEAFKNAQEYVGYLVVQAMQLQRFHVHQALMVVGSRIQTLREICQEKGFRSGAEDFFNDINNYLRMTNSWEQRLSNFGACVDTAVRCLESDSPIF